MVPGNCRCYGGWTCEECSGVLRDNLKYIRAENERLRSALLSVVDLPVPKPDTYDGLLELIHGKASEANKVLFPFT